MKLLLVPAILLLALPGATVRFESDGIRVGDEVVTGKLIGLKTSGELPILVSSSTIENLSSSGRALEVAVDDKKVLLEVGVRMERQGEAYRLSTHGPTFAVSAAGKSLELEAAASFKVSEKGFDFGKQGVLEGNVLTAKIASTLVAQDPPGTTQEEPKLRSRIRQQSNRAVGLMHRVFTNGDPTVTSEAADGQAIKMLLHVSPTGSP